MIRRTALAACAVVAVTALSSCSTFSRNDAAAEVGGHELSRDDVAALVAAVPASATPPSDEGAGIRDVISRWAQTLIFEQVAGLPVEDGTENLDVRFHTALLALVGDEARALYQLGLSGSPVVCLGAIQVASEADAQQVVDALNAGMSFADASNQFNADAGLKGVGGVVADQTTGSDCSDTSSFSSAYVPELIDAVSTLAIGAPSPVVSLGGAFYVFVLRPFDVISPASQDLVMGHVVTPEIVGSASGTDVHVDSRYGRWDAASLTVVPMR